MNDFLVLSIKVYLETIEMISVTTLILVLSLLYFLFAFCYFNIEIISISI